MAAKKKVKKNKSDKESSQAVVKRKRGRPVGSGDKRGRPPKTEIDFKMLENLCKIQCTAEEVAGVLEVSVDTVYRRIDEKHGITFAEYKERYAAQGRASLRRSQFKLAEKNSNMSIWLGKQVLGQRDKVDGGIVINNNNGALKPAEEMTDEELLEAKKKIVDNVLGIIDVKKIN